MFKEIEELSAIQNRGEYASFISTNKPIERLTIKYYFDDKSKVGYSQVEFHEGSQGPPGHVHGGALMAIFDELMGATAWLCKSPSMTVEHKTYFLAPVPLGSKLLFSCYIQKTEGRKIYMEGVVKDESRQTYARAEGLFIKITKEHFLRSDKIPKELMDKMNNEGVSI